MKTTAVKRAETAGRIAVASLTYPHMRLGQFISNAVGADIFYVTDDDLAKMCEQYAAKSKHKLGCAVWHHGFCTCKHL